MVSKIYQFGTFELQPERGALLKDGKQLRLGNRALEILIALVEHAGEVVSNQELIARVWPETFVDENNLRVHLTAIRRALQDDKEQMHYILNVPGRGYRFAAPVTCQRTEIPSQKTSFHLPVLLTRLVGRNALIQELIAELPNHRLMTIVGTGGMGKTSVALAVAHQVSALYEDGVCFVDLTSLTDAKRVPAALAAALRLPLSSEAHTATLAEFLGKKRILIILDNCEHVIQEATLLVEDILKATPQVQFLTTSREPLRGEGEWLHRLLPLDAPSPEDAAITAVQALAFPAVQLFVERATSSLESFQLTDADAPLLAALCHRLDGIPLAIELAAARVDLFSIADLTAQLTDHLSLLSRGRRTAQERHRTLRATLDWSYALLPEIEQKILARLSVFKSIFSREAAIEVAACKKLKAEDVLDALTNLAAKSLIATRFKNGRAFYRLLDTTRAYAAEKLNEDTSSAKFYQKHALYCRAEAKRLEALDISSDADRSEETRRLIDEIRAALIWAYGESGDAALGLELTVASSFVWYKLSLLEEYRLHAEHALDRMKDRPDRSLHSEMELLLAIGPALYNTAGPIPEVHDTFARAHAIAKEIEGINGQFWTIRGIWQYRYGIGEYDEALKILDGFEAHKNDLDDPTLLWHRIRTINHLYRGELAIAREYAEHVIRQAGIRTRSKRGLYDYDWFMFAHTVLARILWLQGFPVQAMHQATLGIEEGLAIKHSLSVCFSSALAACPIAFWTGDLAHARECVALLKEHSASSALPHWHRYSEMYESALERLHPQSDERPKNFKKHLWVYKHHEELGVLGEGFATDEIIDRAKSEEALWYAPEILRLEAVKMARKGTPKAKSEAIALLKKAIAVAKRQGALSWELRAATTLAELTRSPDALAALETVLDQFTEGFDMPDYKKASGLLHKNAVAN